MAGIKASIEGLVILIDPSVLRLPGMKSRYVWRYSEPNHDFYEIEALPENDRVRYTISPTARKEDLRRLLALNHKRAEAEQAVLANASPVKSPKQTRKIKSDASSGNLFG